jgi:glucose/arabinose dehydrogenase
MDLLPNDRDNPAPLDAERRASLKRLGLLWAAVALPLAACGGSSGPNQTPTSAPPGGGSSDTPPPPPDPGPPPPAAWTPKTTVLNSTLASPWSLAFLPDGRMLVTQRGGSMVILSADGATKSGPLAGVPTVSTDGQGGLLDVVLDPDYATAGSDWIYFSYSEPGTGGNVGTSVTRARLDSDNLQLLDKPLQPLFQQAPKVTGGNHFGSRLVFGTDKKLFITLGERDKQTPAQDLTGHLGKVVRINRDGTIPNDNPFFSTAGAKQEIWSYGHRNPQGAALHPTTGELWTSEHGPQGGDEINRPQAGKNYGWPVISWGQSYGTTTQFGEGTTKAGMEQPVTYWEKSDGSAWTPGTQKSSIAPSGLAFYTGTQLTGWQGNLFSGSLAGKALWRLVLNGNTITSRERLLVDLNRRIRCVRQGPDGWLYLLTDEGELIRVTT